LNTVPEHPTPPPAWLETVNRQATVAAQLSSVAHEVNNLLQIVAGSAELLEMSPADPEVTIRRARTIRDHVQRASALLAGVLEFSRDESTAAAACDVGAVVARALDLRKYVMTRQRIAVRTEPIDGAVAAIANPRRTLQIVLNLLINAEYALRSRTVDAAIVIRIARGEGCARVTVEDNAGGGVTLDAPLESVPVARSVPRLGIGLRVSRWLALEQGGALDVDERAGVTAVTLTLPAPPSERN